MGFIVTAYDLDSTTIAAALHTLANDIASEEALVHSASDSINVDTEDDERVHLGIELDVVLTHEAEAQRLLDLSE